MIAEKNLRLPSAYVEVTDNEMEYLDGEGLFGQIWNTVFSAVGGVVAIAGGVVALAVPEPTGATKVGGILAIVGGSLALANIVSIWS